MVSAWCRCHTPAHANTPRDEDVVNNLIDRRPPNDDDDDDDVRTTPIRDIRRRPTHSFQSRHRRNDMSHTAVSSASPASPHAWRTNANANANANAVVVIVLDPPRAPMPARVRERLRAGSFKPTRARDARHQVRRARRRSTRRRESTTMVNKGGDVYQLYLLGICPCASRRIASRKVHD